MYNLKSTLPNNYYVARYNYNGDFISAISLNGGIYADSFRINCLHVTPANKILIGGFYTDSFDVDAGPDSTILTSPSATMFVVKYDDDENYLGVIHGDNYHDYAFANIQVSSSAIDKTGNMYVCGKFYGSYDFDPGPNQYILSSPEASNGSIYQNGYFAKYDKNGKLLFAKALISGDNSVNDIAVDNNSNIYLTGVCDGFTDFDPGSNTYYLNNSDTAIYSSYDYFIAKYDANGNIVFAKGSEGSYYLNVTSIALDAKNNFCIAGKFNGSMDFDPGINTHIINGDNNLSLGNMFLAKYDSAGNYAFAYCIKSANSTGTITDLKFDNSNNIVFTGIFYGDGLDFNPGPNKFLLSSGSLYDAGFISVYKNNGLFVSAIGINGQDDYYSHFSCLSTDKNDNVYLTGSSTNQADFDPGTVQLF